MARLCVCEKYLTVVLHEEFFAFSLDAETGTWVLQKIIKCNENIQKANDGSIECCAFSPRGNYFGVCYDKNLIIYDTLNWSILYNSPGERKAYSLKFFPTSKIVLLADKSGCAGFYTFHGDKLEKSEISIGHNSMLTGALVTENEKYVVTCDRDEKIRVTNYPQVYNIERYCLGHRLFVSCIEFLPSDQRILVSSSGDGTIRFWDFVLGKEVAIYDCNNVNENVKTTITKIKMCKLGNKSIVAVVEYKSNSIRLLSVEGNMTTDLKVNLINILEEKYPPWDITFWGENLVFLLPDKSQPFKCWSIDKNNAIKSNDFFRNIGQYLSDNWDSFLEMSHKISDNIPILFKREVDNLQEYEKRKKARLLKTGRTS